MKGESPPKSRKPADNQTSTGYNTWAKSLKPAPTLGNYTLVHIISSNYTREGKEGDTILQNVLSVVFGFSLVYVFYLT